ncbi:MAG: gliding motility protein GldN [Bacteroidaceae bacterium]|nr:gliding motility protein GldN [Bacteroidaceae bacterium]
MNYINRLLIVIAMALLGQYAVAQPPARKREKSEKKESATTYNIPMSERAKSQYPKNEVPTEVVWKRDLYRVLDLEKEKNASLYYPVEPIGDNVNLFTYIFRLILDNSITAYTYNLDGYESFTPENKVKPQDMLDNYRIYYEYGEDSTFIVGTSDIPSGEVLSYYIKESYYFDQRTATYNHRVTAICPVLHRAGEFSSEVTKYPMFWLNYDEIAPLLARQSLMTSSYNNVSSMSIDDYFTKHSYEGEIYKTVNLRNLAINQYCKDSTEVKKEQEKIEKQLKDFEANLWASESKEEKEDSTSVDKKKSSEKNSTKRVTKSKEPKSKKSVKASSKNNSGSNSSGAARVSVRRQRR